jgi:cell division protein FtsL
MKLSIWNLVAYPAFNVSYIMSYAILLLSILSIIFFAFKYRKYKEDHREQFANEKKSEHEKWNSNIFQDNSLSSIPLIKEGKITYI